MKMENGGPAFPRSPVLHHDEGQVYAEYRNGQKGMSLRDYFAGQVLNGFAIRIRDNGWPIDPDDAETLWAARAAYAIADAMLKQRERKEDSDEK